MARSPSPPSTLRSLTFGLEQVWRDAVLALRGWRRSRVFSLTVIVTLALCIGANTTIFSVLYGLILRPLPFHDSGQLVEIYNSLPKNDEPKRRVSIAQYLEYKANADLFDGFAMWVPWSFNVGEESDAERGIGARVTADYFTLLGVQPLLGRFYTMEECAPGQDNVVVLTQTYWEKRYRSDPSVIGHELQLNNQPFTIIGVAPRRLEALNSDTTLMKPFEWRPQQADPQARGATSAVMYARIKPGVAHGAALAQLHALEQRFQEEVASPAAREYFGRTGFTAGLGQVRAEQTKPVRTSLLLLQGGALLVLLLGCVNVANLMLARANGRRGDLAVRQALGAGRGALARQLLTEGLVLAAAGAVLGFVLCWISLRLINTYTTAIVREVEPIALNGTVATVAALATVLVAATVSLLPIVQTWRRNLLGAIQGGTRGASASGGLRVTSGVLITGQVALALMLLVGAGLLLRSFSRVMAIHPGFDASRVIEGRIAFGSAAKTPEMVRSMHDLILERMREMPGAERVGATGSFALSGRFGITPLPIRGSALNSEDTFPRASIITASPEYFDVMGIRLLDGRVFTEADTQPGARQVFVVDENFARKYFPGRSAVGETFDFRRPDEPPERWPMIVGVVTVAKLNGLDDTSGVPFVFVPLRVSGAMTVLVRTSLPASQVVPMMREKLRSVDPSLPLYHEGSLEDGLVGLLANRQGVMWLLSAFAGIALLLSAVGIYGMLAYDVSQRTREIGIRGAIGATREQIVGMILRQGLTKTGLGLALGLIGAYLLSRYMGSLLFDVKPTDPLAYAGVTLLLLAIATLASWLPARRAAKIDPIVALRAE
jgi:putative ABC transport system permease protein